MQVKDFQQDETQLSYLLNALQDTCCFFSIHHFSYYIKVFGSTTFLEEIISLSLILTSIMLY